jgi:hypothetical protein
MKMCDRVEVEIRILKDGDEIIGLWENRVLIKHKDGSAEFFILDIDSNGYPRLNNKTWKITKGDGEVHISSRAPVGKKSSNKKVPPKVITF